MMMVKDGNAKPGKRGDAEPGPPYAAEAPAAPDAPRELEVEADGFKPNPEVLDAAISKDMRKVRLAFIKQWSEWKKTQTPDADAESLRKDSAEQWMNSKLRAQVMATRKHEQF